MSLAVVTGGARGIGRAACLWFARRGLDVVVLGRGPGLEEVATEIRALGARALSLACDVSHEGEVEEARSRAVEELGTPDVIVHSAGIVHRGASVAETTAASWDEVVATNLRGPFLVSRAFLPSMLLAQRGRLVFVGSISSTIGCPGTASYAASKWGVVGLAKSLAEELRPSGLVSVAVLPGSVDTDMLKGSGFPPVMSADEVAATIGYLALDAPAAVNGSAVELFG